MVEWDGGGQHIYFPPVKINLQLRAIFWMSFTKTEARLKNILIAFVLSKEQVQLNNMFREIY